MYILYFLYGSTVIGQRSEVIHIILVISSPESHHSQTNTNAIVEYESPCIWHNNYVQCDGIFHNGVRTLFGSSNVFNESMFANWPCGVFTFTVTIVCLCFVLKVARR